MTWAKAEVQGSATTGAAPSAGPLRGPASTIIKAAR